MQPSSLIFLVIVAIWVAYLVQHWVRRREHLATARSVDKFSEAMRLLERRSPVPSIPSTSPARSAASGSGRHSAGVFNSTTPDGAAAAGPAPSPLRARSRADGPLPPAHDIPLIELVPHRTPMQILLRRVRGLLFLASLVAVPVCLILSAAHILKWLSIGIAAGALVAVTVWLRVEAVRDQKVRRARRAAHRHLADSRARVGGTSSRGRRTLADPAPAASRTAKAEAALGHAHTPAAETGTDEGAVAEPVAAPGAWRPVPVPPPTYTLKEPAHPREPNRPVPIEVEDEIESVPAVRQRRVVGS